VSQINNAGAKLYKLANLYDAVYLLYYPCQTRYRAINHILAGHLSKAGVYWRQVSFDLLCQVAAQVCGQQLEEKKYSRVYLCASA